MSDDLKCSFCYKTSREVKFLIASAENTFICDECVGICNNILGNDVKTGEKPDQLETMWQQQHDFMLLLQETRSFPEFPTDITSKKGQKFLKDITHHMMDELFEAGQHLKNAKSHRATLVPEVDREAFKEELVDALHLYLELVIASGITLPELVESYMKKGEINVSRIKSGY
jgi:hypothetical protein